MLWQTHCAKETLETPETRGYVNPASIILRLRYLMNAETSRNCFRDAEKGGYCEKLRQTQRRKGEGTT